MKMQMILLETTKGEFTVGVYPNKPDVMVRRAVQLARQFLPIRMEERLHKNCNWLKGLKLLDAMQVDSPEILLDNSLVRGKL